MEQKSKVKVAFITTGIYGGGAERNIINLAIKFHQSEVESEIISLKTINDFKTEYGEELKKITTIYILKDQSKINRLTLPFKAIKLLIKLFFIISKKKYKVLIAAEEFTFLITTLFAKLFFIKSILIVGNNIEKEVDRLFFLRKMFSLLIFKISFFLADKLICVSKGLELMLKKFFPLAKNKIELIYNGLDILKIKKMSKKPLPDSYKPLFKYPIIITVGRLVQKKGFDDLIEAFKIIKKTNNNLKLFIIGKGPEKINLIKQAHKLGLKNYIIFHDSEKKNIYRFIKRAKIFVFSSLYEGFGNVIVEAMACGLPVVSTDCDYGPREILCNKINYPLKPIKKVFYANYGVLVPDKNKNKQNCKEIASAIINLIKNKQKMIFYRKKSLLRANKFTLDKMANQYKKVILSFKND